MTGWWLPALLTGLAASLHCLGMCGPLVLALPVGRFAPGQRGLVRAVYHTGRLSAYAGLGAVVGLLGQRVLLSGLQQPVSIGAGLLLLGWLALHRSVPQARWSVVVTRWLTAPMSRLIRHPRFGHVLLLGWLNGLLPCGSVYVAVAGALATFSVGSSVGYMLLFGSGTLPALLGLQLVAGRLTPLLRHRLTRTLPAVTLLVGLLLIGRGLYGYAYPTDPNQPIPLCHGR